MPAARPRRAARASSSAADRSTPPIPPRRSPPCSTASRPSSQTLLDEVVARDFPFLGACYGIGTLGAHQGATIDRTYPEPISVVPVTLTEAGGIRPAPRRDAARPSRRSSATRRRSRCCPPSAVLLASSPTCPVQMFRVGAERLRDAVPPRARRRRHHDADPRLRRSRLLRRRRARAHARRRASCGRVAPEPASCATSSSATPAEPHER